MEIKQRTSYQIEDNFIYNLLKDRGIISNKEEYDTFLNPTINEEHSPDLLDHMEEGYQLLKKHLAAGSSIYVPQDPDADGLTSASLFWNYLEDNCRERYPGFTLTYHIPEGKEHGLGTLMKDLKEKKKYDLIVMIDSSSNDYEEHKILSEMGYDILVIDHHLAEKYSEYAIVINNQLSEHYPNKGLSGVGVCYKFLEYFENKEQLPSKTKDYLDVVALGIIGDVMPMTTLENRWIVTYGLSHLNNKFLKKLVEQQSYSLKYPEVSLNSTGVAFYLVPLINALIRVGSPIEKERLFQAFITPDIEVPSTKRGEKGLMETIATQSVRNCVNAKARQTRERDKAAELLDIQILENNLDENKVLILNADDLNVSNNLTGLCAMGVAAKYKKPVLLGRITPDGKTMKGSIRNKDGSPIKDLRRFLLNSGLMEYVEGHSSAAGFGLPVSKIGQLIEYCNTQLRNIDLGEGSYEADFIVRANCQYLTNLIFELSAGAALWGQNNPEALIAVNNISIDKNSIAVMGRKNLDTIKFKLNGINYIQFKATDLIEKLDSYSENLIINLVGTPNINSWGGVETPQIQIKDIEIKELNLEGF